MARGVAGCFREHSPCKARVCLSDASNARKCNPNTSTKALSTASASQSSIPRGESLKSIVSDALARESRTVSQDTAATKDRAVILTFQRVRVNGRQKKAPGTRPGGWSCDPSPLLSPAEPDRLRRLQLVIASSGSDPGERRRRGSTSAAGAKNMCRPGSRLRLHVPSCAAIAESSS